MRTPGYLKEPLFYLRTLTLISVLSIGLQTFKVASNISDGNISGQKENLEVRLGELQLKATGKNTTAVVLNLLKILNSSDVEHSKREILSLHLTPGKTNYEETKQLFINGVLTESDGSKRPAFYNSNILGRYYRKDYFPHPLTSDET